MSTVLNDGPEQDRRADQHGVDVRLTKDLTLYHPCLVPGILGTTDSPPPENRTSYWVHTYVPCTFASRDGLATVKLALPWSHLRILANEPDEKVGNAGS